MPSNDSEAVQLKPARKNTLGGSILAFVLYLLEIILPVAAAGGLLWYLFASYNLWQNNRGLMVVVFSVVMVIIALILTVVLDSLTTPLRKAGKRVRFGGGMRARLAKLAIAGILLPVALAVAANLVAIAPGQTAMDLLVSASPKPVVKTTPPDEIGALARQSSSPSTKILSYQVLRGFNTAEGLNQLLLAVRDDPTALADSAVAAELSSAIAGYGGAAKEPLLKLYTTLDPTRAGTAQVGSTDLYERYFAGGFDSLKNEISASVPDSAGRSNALSRLQAAQDQLKAALSDLQVEEPAAKGDPRADFILKTFLAMDISQDNDLLAFARATAADTRLPSAVRGDALLLVGKLGGSDDLPGLYAYLAPGGDNLLQTRALQAIAAIQAKINKTPSINK